MYSSKKRYSLRGSLTVFLALLLSVFLGFTGVLLDYARAQMLSYQVQAAVSAGAESVFAGYYAPLFARYQLMARYVPDGSLSGLEEETREYIDAWGCGSSPGSRIRLASFRTENARWSDLVYMTDGRGSVFRDMASRSMKAQAAEVLASFWQEHLGLSNPEIMGSLQEYNNEKDARPGKLFPDYKDLKEKVREAEKAEKEAAKKAKEEEEALDKAIQEAVDAGEEPPERKEPSKEEIREKKQEKKERAKGKKFLDLLDTVRKILGKGLLSVVLPDGASVPEAGIPSGGLPSSLSPAEKGRSAGGGGSGNSLLFREYLMRNMDCYTSDTGKRPVCELEYLIAGKKSDRANLESVVRRILAVRLGLNLLHVSASEEKQAAAMAAATLAVGWTGQAALIEIVSGLLLTAWAVSESLADVRVLMDGGRVELLKTDDDWQIALKDAASAWKAADGSESRSKTKGLSYEDYLRILLYLTSLEKLSYRGMDVIQWNLNVLDSGFRMKDCFTEGTLTARAKSRVLFRPLYRAAVRGENGELMPEKTSRYSYREDG